MRTDIENNAQPAPKQRGPALTWLVCASCVAIFFELSQRSSSLQMTLYNLTTAQESYWGLITSVFTHVQVWHVFLNVYWLWVLGGLLEREIPRMQWIAFFLLAAVVSSGAQLVLTGNTGIGASGVVYAMFGFIWIGREHYPGFGSIATKQNVILFLGWLVICIVATRLGTLSIGNAAHVSGLLFGMGTAYLVLKRSRPSAVKESSATV